MRYLPVFLDLQTGPVLLVGAGDLARAKGLFDTMEQPGRLMVFQFAGGRATLAPGGTPTAGMPRTRIVFVAEIGVLSSAEIDRIMDASKLGRSEGARSGRDALHRDCMDVSSWHFAELSKSVNGRFAPKAAVGMLGYS